MPRDKINSNSPEEKARFDAEKSLLRTEVLGHLDELDDTLKDREKKVDRDKILSIFDESAGGSQREKIVINENTGTKILKEKGGNKREKIKIDHDRVLKIKDRNNREFLNIDLDKNDLKRNVGNWLLDLKKEVIKPVTPEVKEKVPEIRNNSITLNKGEIRTYDLEDDVNGNAESYDINLPDFGKKVKISFNLKNPGEITFGNDLPEGIHKVKWKAVNEAGESEEAILTVKVKEKNPDVVQPESREIFENNFKDAETAVEEALKLPMVGVGSGGQKEYNLESVAQQIRVAKQVIAKAEKSAKGNPELIARLKPLKNKIEMRSKELELEKAKKAELIKNRPEDTKKIIDRYFKEYDPDTDNDQIIVSMKEDLKELYFDDGSSEYKTEVEKKVKEYEAKKKENEEKIAGIEDRLAELKNGTYEANHAKIISDLEVKLAALKKNGGDKEKISKLEKEIQVEKDYLEKAQQDSAKFITELEKAVKNAQNEQIEAQKKHAQEMTKLKNDLEKQQKEAANDAFEKIKSGEFQVENKGNFDNFDPNNLNNIDGARFEVKKHNLARKRYEMEVKTLDLGMQGMDAKFAEFNEKKGEFSFGKLAGGLGAAGVVGAAVVGTIGWPVVLAGAGVVAAGALIKNGVGAIMGKESTGWWKNGSIMGIFGGNEKAYAEQKGKLVFEKNYDKASADLKAKGKVLADHGKAITAVTENPQDLLDNQVKDILNKSDLNTDINNLYYAVGENPANFSEDIAKIKKAKEEEIIAKYGDGMLEKLRNDSTALIDSDNKIFVKYNNSYFETQENHLDNMSFEAADIGDYTFGFIGKKLGEYGNYLTETNTLAGGAAGGVLNAIGGLSEAAHMVISHPAKVINGVLGLVFGVNFSSDHEGSWYGNYGEAWGNLGKGVISYDSLEKANNKNGWPAAAAYTSWGAEVLTNVVIAILSGGSSAEVQGGNFIARTGSRFASGVRNIGKIVKKPYKIYKNIKENPREVWKEAGEKVTKIPSTVKNTINDAIKAVKNPRITVINKARQIRINEIERLMNRKKFKIESLSKKSGRVEASRIKNLKAEVNDLKSVKNEISRKLNNSKIKSLESHRDKLAENHRKLKEELENKKLNSDSSPKTSDEIKHEMTRTENILNEVEAKITQIKNKLVKYNPEYSNVAIEKKTFARKVENVLTRRERVKMNRDFQLGDKTVSVDGETVMLKDHMEFYKAKDGANIYKFKKDTPPEIKEAFDSKYKSNFYEKPKTKGKVKRAVEYIKPKRKIELSEEFKVSGKSIEIEGKTIKIDDVAEISVGKNGQKVVKFNKGISDDIVNKFAAKFEENLYVNPAKKSFLDRFKKKEKSITEKELPKTAEKAKIQREALEKDLDVLNEEKAALELKHLNAKEGVRIGRNRRKNNRLKAKEKIDNKIASVKKEISDLQEIEGIVPKTTDAIKTAKDVAKWEREIKSLEREFSHAESKLKGFKERELKLIKKGKEVDESVLNGIKESTKAMERAEKLISRRRTKIDLARLL